MDTDPIVTEPDAEAVSARMGALKSARGSRIELITRAEPRRQWSTEQKQAIAAESLAPGASPSAVARRYGIGTGLLYTWRKALLAAQPGLSRFARVEVANPQAASPAMHFPVRLPAAPVPLVNSIEIVLPNNTLVRVDAQIDPRALRRVLSVLIKS